PCAERRPSVGEVGAARGGEEKYQGQSGDPAEGGEQASGGECGEDGNDGRHQADRDGPEDELPGFAEDEGADDFPGDAELVELGEFVAPLREVAGGDQAEAGGPED